MDKIKLHFWNVVLVVLLVPGAYSLIYRLTHGLGYSTNLTDEFPWGLWVGFKLFSVALAGGGFTLAAVVYIFNIQRYKPVLRAMILTAFLGYSMFIASLILDLGRPLRIWHPLVMWNHHSVMFEIAWCVMLYTTVLFLEFLPVVLERFGLKKQIEMDARDYDSAGHSGRGSVDSAPIVAGQLVPDRAWKAVPAVVLLAGTGFLLHLGDLRGTGHDHLRIVARG